MSDQIQSTISLLSAKIATKEEEVNKLKKLVNELSVEAGLVIPFPNLSDSSQSLSSMRSDQFYGQALSGAIRSYLEMRRAANLGAASVNEIYSALKSGGFKSDAKDEENAKNAVRLSLRKSSSIFHRLPNGEYGLLAWYPSAKSGKDEDGDEVVAQKAHARSSGEKSKPEAKGNFFSPSEIRDAILSRTAPFKAADIEQDLGTRFPSKQFKANALPTLIYNLKQKGLLKMVAERTGTSGATYAKT